MGGRERESTLACGYRDIECICRVGGCYHPKDRVLRRLQRTVRNACTTELNVQLKYSLMYELAI